jgi:hypothetical protein
MKSFLFALCLSISMCRGQQFLGITSARTNATIHVLHTNPTRVYQMQSSTNLVDWSDAFPFRGSTNMVSTNVASAGRIGFYRVVSQPEIVTNLFFSFSPYPYKAGTWQAFPTLDHADFIGGWSSRVSINGVVWVVFVRSDNFLEIRTESAYAIPPVFHVGDEVMLLD